MFVSSSDPVTNITKLPKYTITCKNITWSNKFKIVDVKTYLTIRRSWQSVDFIAKPRRQSIQAETKLSQDIAVSATLLCIKRCRDPSVRLSVCLSVPPGLGAQCLGQLDAQRLGQATSAVRTADPSAHGRRSSAIGGGHIVSPRDNLFCFNCLSDTRAP